MKRLLLGILLVYCAEPALAEEHVRLPAENVSYGCYDVENAKEIERIRAEGDASSSSVGSAYGAGARAVDQFVREHNIGLSPHKPHFFSNVCVQLPADIDWKVVRTYDWPDGGGPRLVCLAPTEKFDLGPQAGASPPHDESSCWWTNLHNE